MKKFVANERSRTLHRIPTQERCNMDQAERTKKFAQKPKGYRLCRHCFAPRARVFRGRLK